MDIKSFVWTTFDFFDSEGQVTARGCATKDKVIVDASEIIKKKTKQNIFDGPFRFSTLSARTT